MPADNNNEETRSQEALLEELERLKQIVGNNGFSRKEKEALLDQFNEMGQQLLESLRNENSQRVSQDGPDNPMRVLREQVVQKARTDQSSRNRTSPQKSNDPRESALSWIPKFSAFIFAIVLLGILITIIVAIFITKSIWLAPLSLILLLGTKPFLHIVNNLYPLNKERTEAIDEESNESSPLSQALSPLTELIEKINGSKKK